MKRLRLTAAYLNSTWHGLPYAGTFYTVLALSEAEKKRRLD
ncbi:hypothetical protein E2C01_093873 [Portunus trituberculatus]|uniref:Uncharacterized protein n=1 Tax=Portunus trituberculatus TaxID=210409 RepID=A0A5B7JNW6_PORTR|nr:hypothetical protein [Portunus trituberculatus]